MSDFISRQAAIDALKSQLSDWNDDYNIPVRKSIENIERLPSAQMEQNNAAEFWRKRADFYSDMCMNLIGEMGKGVKVESVKISENGIAFIKEQPSAQPERTCVNCGRTVNNGGWYADGGTRCPIEEHYALPKDGYCHLWEKRNVTDDDYPERREE